MAMSSEEGKGINLNKLEMINLITRKEECERRAHEILLVLIEENVSKDYLIENAIHLHPRHFEDIVEERRISKICGWALCDKPLGEVPKQKYHIKAKANKILDISERKGFCSNQCYAIAVDFKTQLLTTPLWTRDEDEDDDPKFKILETNTSGLEGINITFSLTLDDDDIDEKEINDEKGEDDGTSDEETNEKDQLKSTEL